MQNNNDSKFKVWDPLNIFRCPIDYSHAVVILNRPILLDHNTVLPLWKKAKITVTVDGGTNRWINYLSEEQADSLLKGKSKDYLPTLVTGDMDSIKPELLQRFEQLDSVVIRTPDQNATDYTKALMRLQLHATENNIHLDGVYVIAEYSGRFDHIIANINTLYKAECLMEINTEIIQVSSNSLTWLLRPGKHKILIPDTLIACKSWCALIPFGTSNSRVTTTGLKWNLLNACMRFSGMVSTSNTYSGSPEVIITTSEPIVWSMGIEPFTKTRRDSDSS